METSIKVKNANTVILGLGIATLITTSDEPCIEVGDVDGVRVAGILFQAGEKNSEALLKWGSDSKYAGNIENPGVASDIFARVGGPNDPSIETVTTGSMMVVNSGYVVIDNTWLWRADHDVTGDVRD